MPTFRESLDAGRRDGHKHGLSRGLIQGAITAVAVFSPGAWWKRLIGALLAFLIVGCIVQFRAMRKERAKQLPEKQPPPKSSLKEKGEQLSEAMRRGLKQHGEEKERLMAQQPKLTPYSASTPESERRPRTPTQN